jgi:hypothetical protein
MDAITLLLAALATARITRLITRDRITHAPRRALLARMNPEGLPAYLLVCDFCASVYVGAGTVAAAWAWDWAVWPMAALAASHVTGWLASKEED